MIKFFYRGLIAEKLPEFEIENSINEELIGATSSEKKEIIIINKRNESRFIN